jgi:hypothetical protein
MPQLKLLIFNAILASGKMSKAVDIVVVYYSDIK